MSLSESERIRLLADLDHFYDELLEYLRLAVNIAGGKYTKRELNDFHNLRLELQRLYGGFETVIEEYGGRVVVPIEGREYGAFNLALGPSRVTTHTFTGLDGAITMVNKAIGKLRSGTLPESVASIETLPPPKAFIANGGETPALNKLREFLNALGVIPVIAQEQPSEDRSVDKQVDWCLDQCDCAIILATKGDIDGRTGEFLPRGNILIEIGKCQERFPGRIVYLIESGTKFPTNISEKVRERFKPQSMDKAFIKVAKELTAFGLIKAVKPE